MPRKPTVRWHDRGNAWRSDVGPPGESGRRTPVYFREVPKTPAGRRRAEAQLEDYLRDRDRKEAAATEEAGNPRLGEVSMAYLRDLRRMVAEEERGARTLSTNAERLGKLLDHAGPDGVTMGDRLIRSITPADGVRWMKALKEAGHGPRYRKGLLSAAQAMLRWAARGDPEQGRAALITANPFQDLKAPRVPKGSRRYVTRAELAAFLRFARVQVNAWTPISGRCSGCVRAKRKGSKCRRQHSRTAALERLTLLLVRVQYHSGTRPGELTAALWSDWNPSAMEMPARDLEGGPRREGPAPAQRWGLITLPPNRHKTGRKKEEDRLIPVRPILARALERFRGSGHAHGTHIFARAARARADGAGSAPWATVSDLDSKLRAWRTGAVEAGALELEPGRPFVLYGMRHAFYTRATQGAGLTADQAGAVGSTGERTVRETYVRRRIGVVMRLAGQIDAAARESGD